MLDQNTDRMWYVIGAVIVGAALIFIMNGTMPDLFASVGKTFEDKVEDVKGVVSEIGLPEKEYVDVITETDGVAPPTKPGAIKVELSSLFEYVAAMAHETNATVFGVENYAYSLDTSPGSVLPPSKTRVDVHGRTFVKSDSPAPTDDTATAALLITNVNGRMVHVTVVPNKALSDANATTYREKFQLTDKDLIINEIELSTVTYWMTTAYFN